MTKLSTETVETFHDILNYFELEGEERDAGMVLLASAHVGANAAKVAAVTGIDIDDVRNFETNLRENEIWEGDQVHSASWSENQMEFLLHIGVAQGLIRAEHQALN